MTRRLTPPNRRTAVLALLLGCLLPGGGTAARADTLCTAVAEVATGRVLLRQGICDRQVTPASTFKIALSLMGYDSGFLTDEHSPLLPFRQGDPDWIPAWRTATDPAAWIRDSVVWYSQRITGALGEERFRAYVAAFRYGNQDVSGDPEKQDGLMRAWLGSSLRISPLEQLDFLARLVRRELPVSPWAAEMTARLTAQGRLTNGWDLYGKTGTGAPPAADGTPDWDHSFGWFVGWAEKEGRSLVFARLIQDQRHEESSAGPRARQAFMDELPDLLDWL